MRYLRGGLTTVFELLRSGIYAILDVLCIDGPWVGCR